MNKDIVNLGRCRGGFPGVGTDRYKNVLIKVSNISEITDIAIQMKSGMFYIPEKDDIYVKTKQLFIEMKGT